MGKANRKEKEKFDFSPISTEQFKEFVRKAQKGICPRIAFAVLLSKKSNTPDIYYDNTVDDKSKLNLRNQLNIEREKFNSAVCSHCRIDENENNKKIKARIMALLRNPAYMKSIQELREIQQSYPDNRSYLYWEDPRRLTLEREIHSKYDLAQPIFEYDKYLLCPHNFEVEYIFEDEQSAVKVIPAEQPKFLRTLQGQFLCIDSKPMLFEGKWLNIKIDLTKKKQIIMQDVEREIDSFNADIRQEYSRNKKYIFDPWIIYDLYHKEGLKFAQIAKKLSGIDESPTYNDTVMKVYKAVKRAYNKACELIEVSEKIPH